MFLGSNDSGDVAVNDDDNDDGIHPLLVNASVVLRATIRRIVIMHTEVGFMMIPLLLISCRHHRRRRRRCRCRRCCGCGCWR